MVTHIFYHTEYYENEAREKVLLGTESTGSHLPSRVPSVTLHLPEEWAVLHVALAIVCSVNHQPSILERKGGTCKYCTRNPNSLRREYFHHFIKTLRTLMCCDVGDHSRLRGL
jgi:hypothetical protein